MQILVVEDDRSTRELQKRLLQKSGYEASYCYNGVDAMELIERPRPDVILLDILLPQMDGFAVAEVLKHNSELRPQCLISVTGLVQDRAKQKAAELGFDHCLLQPVEWPKLSAILQEAASAGLAFKSS